MVALAYNLQIKRVMFVYDHSFLFSCFLCQDVAFVSVFPFDFSSTGEVETLLSGTITFHLWHFTKNLVVK